MNPLLPIPHQDRDRMSAEEHRACLAEGFRPEVVDSLKARGFRRAGSNPDDRDTPYFLRQTATPHLYIPLEVRATLEDLDDAIFDLGGRKRHEFLAGKWDDFTSSMKNWTSNPFSLFEERLRKLEEVKTPPSPCVTHELSPT